MFKVACVAALASAFAAGQTSRDQRLQQDLDTFATQLPKLHVNAFHQVTQQQFNDAVSALAASIPNVSDQQFYAGMAAITAMIGDAHTNLILENDEVFHSTAVAQLGFLNFPIRLHWLDDGVFVEAAAPQYTQLLGTELVALGETPVSDAVAALAKIISHENDQWLHFMAQHYLTSQQVLQALGVLPAGAQSRLTFRKRDGEEFSVTLAGGPPVTLLSYFDQVPGFLPDFLRSPSLNYWYVYLPSVRTLYFKYNACQDMPDLPFATFTQSFLAALDQNPVDTLVVDFRGNGGGNGNLLTPLGLALYQRIPALLQNRAFQLYGVIDKGTFSSGMQNAAGLKEQVPGIDLTGVVHLIGEPTGGKPASYGELKSFLLPNSGLAVNYATDFSTAPYGGDSPSLLPDIAIPMRSADLFARHDPVLAAILGRARIPPPPSGDVITVSAASFRVEQGVSPGSIAVAFGQFPNGADEVRVNGISATIVGGTLSAVIFVVPDSASLGAATITVRHAGADVARGNVTITATSPGIFILDNFDLSQPGAVENLDYSVNSQTTPGVRGGVLEIYATGAGSGSQQPSVFLGDSAAEVQFSGVVGPGLWLINVKVPDGFLYDGQIPRAIAAGGIVSNGSTVWISR